MFFSFVIIILIIINTNIQVWLWVDSVGKCVRPVVSERLVNGSRPRRYPIRFGAGIAVKQDPLHKWPASL